MIDIPNWRTILITIISAIIIALGDLFGVTEVARQIVLWIGGSYVAGHAAANMSPFKQWESFGEQLQSKKFRFTGISLIIVTLLSVFGIDVNVLYGYLIAAYNIFQGIQDGMEQPDDEDGEPVTIQPLGFVQDDPYEDQPQTSSETPSREIDY